MEIEGIKPAFVDKHGPAYSEADVLEGMAKCLESGDAARRIDRREVFNRAVKVLDESSSHLKIADDRFCKISEDLSNNAKKYSGRVRAAADDLASGLMKIEKQANFDRLSRYVDLLERAATAMTILADLEKSGKLEKISTALK